MQQIINFMIELDKLKGVTRKTRSKGADRNENSAEHSWHTAMFAHSLQPYAEAPVDINRVVAMLLVHDVGEIDTGDVIVYATEGWEERKVAELEAVKRIFGLVQEPQRSQLLELWLEFDEALTPEARFAHAADRAIPALLNLENRGQSWVENGISYERVVNRIGPPIKAGCPALWEYMEGHLREENENGWFGTRVR